MALVSNSQNSNSLFSAFNKQYNTNKQSSEDMQDILKSLNIIDPDSLTKDELSLILKRIDDYSGLFTTQQLENIDYYKFNQHVFFDSAVSKVSYSFDRIHSIPYDQDELVNIKYNNKTDGYTTHLLKNIFPKSLGFARFLGNEKIVMYDQQGKILNDSKTKKIGVLNPLSNRFSIDFWLKVNSSGFTNNQLVFKKFDHTTDKQNGFICFISEGTISTNCYINFVMYIDGVYTSSKCLISKDAWQNTVISISHENGNKKISFIINGNIVDSNKIINTNSSLKNGSFGENFKSNNIPLVIGGVFLIENNNTVTSTLTLNIDDSDITFSNLKGDIDEFRLFHKIRSNKTVKKEMHKNIYAQKGLKLYLRLNEPGGDYQNSCLIIDYSGNKLHGLVYQYNSGSSSHSIVSNTSSIKINEDTPLKLEREIDSPVLNSSFTSSVDMRKKLIEKAKEYDKQNPNLIFNLMPRHYFLNSSDFQNLPVFSNDDSYSIPDSIIKDDGSIAKSTSLNPVIPANTELVNIVLIWARFFDQLKMYISSITNILNVDYDSINKNKIIGMQIPMLCKMYGIKFKELLPSATKLKLDSENLNYEDIISEFSIRKIQNILWQRFLINTQDFLRSKGTIRSIESTFNSFGIDYSKFIDIKEFASFNNLNKDNNYSLLNYKKHTVNFGNSLELMKEPIYEDTSINEYSQNKLFLQIPEITSQITKSQNITNSSIKGFGLNWSIEIFFNFKEIIDKKRFLSGGNTTAAEYFKDKQCLMRLDTDGAPSLIVKFEKNNSYYSELGKLTVSIQPVKNNTSHNIDIDLLNVNIFDVPKYLCITQSVNLQTNKLTYNVILDDIGKQIRIKDQAKKEYTTSEIVLRNNINIITSNLSDIANINDIAENPYNLSFYKNQLNLSIGNYNYSTSNLLSATIATNNDTNFQGEIIKVRLWNKKLEIAEVISHTKNIENIGTNENLSLKDIISDFEIKNIQSTLENSVRNWSVEDKANNVIKEEGTENYLPLNTCSILTRNINQTDDSTINFINLMCKVNNIKIDEPNNSNRVNIISYATDTNKQLSNNYNSFPSNSMPVDFNYDEVSRISIDMSIVKVVNNDISNMISNLNDFTKNISNSQSLFEYSYKSLEEMRNSYFEKFSDKDLINYSSIGNIFKYFDNIMSSILYDIVPSSVRFEGFNYVYESHVLERHKYEYKNRYSSDSIVDTDNYASFSRDILSSRRNIGYNQNRRIFDPNNR
jgi:hypothetical protein